MIEVRQRGVALLTAIILVAVAGIMATTIAWNSQLAARRGVAVFTVEQSVAVAQLAEAYGAYAIQTSNNKSSSAKAVNLNTPVHVGPEEVSPGVSLEGSLEDQSGKFNLNNVVVPQNGGGVPGAPTSGLPIVWVVNPEGLNEFTALLTNLNINTEYAARLVDWIDSDQNPTFPGGAEDSFYLTQQPLHRTLNMPITSVSELLAMGMDRKSYAKLAPLVSALPPDIAGSLNVCTAPAEVLDAISGTRSYALQDPKQFAEYRQSNTCYPDKTAFLSNITGTQKTYLSALLGTTPAYFRVSSWVTIGTTRFTLYSLMQHSQGGQTRLVLRTFGTE